MKRTRWLYLVSAKANVIKIRLYITANKRNASLKTDLISIKAESINRGNLHFGERSAGGNNAEEPGKISLLSVSSTAKCVPH